MLLSIYTFISIIINENIMSMRKWPCTPTKVSPEGRSPNPQQSPKYVSAKDRESSI